MRWGILLGLALLVAACQDTSTTPQAPSGPEFAAVAFVDSQDVPFTGESSFVCANGASDDVTISGTMHILEVGINNGRGGGPSRFQLNFANVTGVGLTGTIYRQAGTFQQTFVAGPGETLWETVTLRLVSAGSAFNLITLNRFQFTVNANGSIAVDNFHIASNCD